MILMSGAWQTLLIEVHKIFSTFGWTTLVSIDFFSFFLLLFLSKVLWRVTCNLYFSFSLALLFLILFFYKKISIFNWVIGEFLYIFFWRKRKRTIHPFKSWLLIFRNLISRHNLVKCMLLFLYFFCPNFCLDCPYGFLT